MEKWSTTTTMKERRADHFPEKVHLLMWKAVIGCSSPHMLMICHSLSNFIGCGNPLTFAYYKNPSKIANSERMYCSSYDCLQIVPGIVLVPVCVCKPIFSFCRKTRGHDKCSMPSRVLSSFRTRNFPTRCLSETTNTCQKGQGFVGRCTILS